jgi:hypothetical protein
MPLPPTITLTADGFEIDAAHLADAFGLAAAAVPGLMRAGLITSRCERGEGEDAGRFRLSFFHAGRALRLTLDGNGTILSRALFDRPAPRGLAGPGAQD